MHTTTLLAAARRRLALTAVAGLFVACGIIGALPSKAAAASCEDVSIPVALAPGQPKNQTIRGTHCTPSSPSIMRSVDVLVPGGTYNSMYWDFPLNNGQYSYVSRTLQANRATFNFDRIGTGKSSKPLSALVTFDAEAYTLHQVIQWLKDNRGYQDVTSIGHSAGSITAVAEAARYNDVDRLVATGFIHSPGWKLLLDLGAGGLTPAAIDPQFVGKVLDPGYLTTVDGKRGSAFYSSSADPKVIAYDEAHKDIISGTSAAVMIAQILVPPLLNESARVKVPVLAVVGDQDVLCNNLLGPDCSSAASVTTHEKAWFPAAKSYTAKVIPGTGHNLPLHPSADTSFQVIDQWIKAHD